MSKIDDREAFKSDYMGGLKKMVMSNMDQDYDCKKELSKDNVQTHTFIHQ